MDYSALTEAQQQQYQQQQQQAYDPAQTQAYEAYYAYPNQQQQYDASASHHPQQYDASVYHQQQQYYSHDYYSAATYQPPSQPDAPLAPTPAPAPAPGPPPPPHDSSQIHAPPLHQHHAGAAASAAGHGYAPLQEQQGASSSYPLPPGMNPAAAAAVAALSQLTQFAGTMDAAERAMAERQWHSKGRGMMGPPPAAGSLPPHHHQYPQDHLLHYPMEHGHVSIRPGGGGRTPYRGGGRRGGGPFRGGGGGRSNFGQHPSRQDGGAPPPFRGRGRGRGRMGRGGGRKSYQSAPDSQLTLTAPTPVVEQSAPKAVQQALGQAPPVSAATTPVIPRRPLLPIAWCDICRVDCNSLEILDQHKNGKRHKKTVQRFEEIQKQQKLFAELQAKVALQSAEMNKVAQVGEVKKASAASENIPTAAVLSAQVGKATIASAAPENMPNAVFSAAQVDDVNKASAAPESKPTVVSTAEQNLEPESHKSQAAEGQSEPSKVEAATEAPPTDAPLAEEPLTEGSTRLPRFDGYDRFDRRRGGLKRKMMRFGRGGKRLKSFEPVRGRVPERPKEQPRVCTLCNVMCDTLAVFECHLSGKKHISKIKRFQGQDTVYGPITVYIPPNQPSAYPTKGQEPLFYGLNSHEMLQQEAYVGLNGLQVENYGLQQGEQDGDAEGGAPEPQAMEGLEHPEGEVPATGDQEAVTLDNTESQDPASLYFEAKEPSPAPIALASETAILETEVAFTITEDIIPVPEYGASLGDDNILPGLDAKVEQPSFNIEEVAGGEEMSSQ